MSALFCLFLCARILIVMVSDVIRRKAKIFEEVLDRKARKEAIVQ